MKANVQDSLHIVPPLAEHTHTVILLHGRDSTASEFAAEFFESHASDERTLPEILPSVKWVFPDSSLRTRAQFGSEESQWFDTWEVKNPQEHKDLLIDGLRESITFILTVLRKEASLVPPERIILGGISQGCATAIHALLYGGIRLGGFIGLSGWLPFQDDIEMKARYSASYFTLLQSIRGLFKPVSSNKSAVPLPLNDAFPESELAFKTPVFLSHAQDDAVVPFDNGDMFCWRLEEVLGFDVDWKVYQNGGHSINEPQGVDDIAAFCRRVIEA